MTPKTVSKGARPLARLGSPGLQNGDKKGMTSGEIRDQEG
jgi:hypothetical protein